jgi:hypothetical protein
LKIVIFAQKCKNFAVWQKILKIVVFRQTHKNIVVRQNILKIVIFARGGRKSYKLKISHRSKIWN